MRGVRNQPGAIDQPMTSDDDDGLSQWRAANAEVAADPMCHYCGWDRSDHSPSCPMVGEEIDDEV